MAAPKTCRFCHEDLVDCVCPEDGNLTAVTPLDLPEGSGEWLSRMLGPGPQQPGPPYTHAHAHPVEDDEAEYEPPRRPSRLSTETDGRPASLPLREAQPRLHRVPPDITPRKAGQAARQLDLSCSRAQSALTISASSPSCFLRVSISGPWRISIPRPSPPIALTSSVIP